MGRDKQRQNNYANGMQTKGTLCGTKARKFMRRRLNKIDRQATARNIRRELNQSDEAPPETYDWLDAWLDEYEASQRREWNRLTDPMPQEESDFGEFRD